MALLSDLTWQSMYRRGGGDMVRLFYVPALECAVRYDRTTGYFSAPALTIAARGIEGLLRNNGRMRLIVGCTLEQPELDAIEHGEALRDMLHKRISATPLQPLDPAAVAALELLAWMVAHGYLEVKVAVPTDSNGKPLAGCEKFHAKSGIFEDKAGNRLAFNGSINETENGWQGNWESFHVYCGWNHGVEHLNEEEAAFAALWANKDPSAIVLDVQSAVEQELLRFLPPGGQLPARLQDAPIAPPAATDMPAEPPPIPQADQRELVWRLLHAAPATPGAGDRVGEATSAVSPWPHQVRAFERLYGNWPPKLLIADEVGLGKTIEAGLFLRQAWLSGKAKRILILAPKSVLTQWQLELREKFNLNWPIYDGASLKWLATQARQQLGGTERAVSAADWHKEPVVLVSSQLARRGDRADALLQAAPWDIVVLDEAHHARCSGVSATRQGSPNLLLRLLKGLSTRTKAMVLLTATPMQIHPQEVWDLLNVLGLPGEWTAPAFLRFFDVIALPSPSDADWDWLAKMFRACEQTYGRTPDATVERVARNAGTSSFAASVVLRALRDEANTPRRQLSTAQRQLALGLLRATSPVARLISRHTRALLREYYLAGKISSRVAERQVQDTLVTMTDDERRVYEAVEAYIGSTYNAAAADQKNAVGFVMTIYRRRVASSFHALACTLEKRLKQLRDQSAPILTDEDLPDDGTRDEELDSDEGAALERAALQVEEESDIERLLSAVQSLPVDTKARDTLRVIEELQSQGYQQVIVFTQFTDTLDFLRKVLVAHGQRVMCYSGRGGERRSNDGVWQRMTRDDAKRAFKKGEADILLCTDAAAEGLNFQFCGALINYDMPWNPMRVEQRIGRIDRLGQRFEKIHIASMNYDDTVETDVYAALRERIALFGTFVGRLQPILASLPRSIAEFTLSPRRDRQQVDALVQKLDSDIATASNTGFDLDAITPADLEQPERPAPAYDLDQLDVLLRRSDLLPNGYHAQPLEPRTYSLTVPGLRQAVRVTTSREFYEDQADSAELWSPGSPLFPAPPTEPEAEQALGTPLPTLLSA